MNSSADRHNKTSRILLFKWLFWFLSLNSLLFMFASLNFVKAMTLPDALPAKLFIALAYPGHFISLVFYLYPLIALLILLYPSRKPVQISSACITTILLLVIIVDSLVFAQYRFHLNGMVWNLLTSGAVKDILPITGQLWLVLIVSLSVVMLVEWGVAGICWRWVQRERKHSVTLLAGIFLVVILAGHFMHAWADANHYTAITKQVRYLPAYKPLTMKKLLVKLGLVEKDAQENSMHAAGGSALAYPLETISCAETAQKKINLLLIVIDSWRFDALSPEITPNIWRLAKDSWQFDNHFSSGNATRFGIFGLFYGIYGTYWHSMLAEEKSPVLMRELARQQYRMEILASAPLINPEFDRTVFSDIRTKIEVRQSGAGSVENDRIISQKMVDFIASSPKNSPFFGFMFFDSPHVAGHPDATAPFQPELKEVNHLTLNKDTDPVPYFNRYKNAVYYNDILIGKVLDQLKKSNLLDSTVVMITGDHGEEFNDLKLNYWGHVGNFARYQTQTPLVVHWPGRKQAAYSHTTSHMDIVPTLMKDLLSCGTDSSKYSNGRHLLDTSPRPYIVISSWDTFSTNEPDRITVVQKSGEMDIFDQSYRPVPSVTVRPEVSKSVMEGMGRFYAR